MITPVQKVRELWISGGHWILLGICFFLCLATGYSFGVKESNNAVVQITQTLVDDAKARELKWEKEKAMFRENISKKNAQMERMTESFAKLGISVGEGVKASNQTVKNLTEKEDAK